jgi:phosphoglycolate phosphatase-like HAD superfamily hydrolase
MRRNNAAGSLETLAVFDLDDTLIDTTGVLVPAALASVARAIHRGVSSLNARGKSIEEVLAGVRDLTDEERSAASASWYDPAVPPLELLPGVDVMLRALKGKIHLALLTRGNADRQRAKIRACQLDQHFKSIRIRDIEGPGSKADDIRSFMIEFNVSAENTAVIGDDPSDEIFHGAELGCLTILVPETPIAAISECLKNATFLGTNDERGDDAC